MFAPSPGHDLRATRPSCRPRDTRQRLLSRNSEHLATAWQKSAAPVDLKFYPGVDHIDLVAAFSGFLHKSATTREDVLDWIDTY
jgi:hypothetical protein